MPSDLIAQGAEYKAAQWTDDRVAALTRLKGLLDDGVLTQEEFDAEKQKILQSG